MAKRGDRQECLSYKNTAADYPAAVPFGSCRTWVCNISLSLPLRSPCILFVECLRQALKIGIESNKAGGSLEEGLPAGVIRQTI